MVFSLALYGQAWGEAVEAEMDGDAAEALRGLYRLGALALTVPVFGLLGLPLAMAVIRLRRFLSAEGLMLIGVGSALLVSIWNTFMQRGDVYFETASMVLVLVTLGRWLESSAKARATRRLHDLLPATIEKARRVGAGGQEDEVPADELVPGELIRVLPGDVLPVDGVVVEGRAFLDTSSVTGESQPRSVRPGSEALAGSIPTDGSLVVRVVAAGRERVLERAQALLDQAAGQQGASGRLADRVATVLLPVVLLLAVGTAGLRWGVVGPEKALLDALCVVLISCPCALGIATPLAFWIAMGEAWKRGVLVRGAEVIEDLARVRGLLFDKTGTLTTGGFRVDDVRLLGSLTKDDVLERAAALEAHSEHPIGAALREAWRLRGGQTLEVVDFRAVPGVGVEGTLAGVRWRLERAPAAPEDPRTRVTLYEEERALAEIALVDPLRPEARGVVEALREQGLGVAVLTGDGPGPAGALERELGIEVEHSLTPEDKVRLVQASPRSAFVGDGLNDSAALAAASIGISVFGGVGRSLESASVNLLAPGLDALPELFQNAGRAVRVARGNLIWAFAYNAVGLGLAASGRLTPIFAAAAMAASSLIVVLNSGRLLAGSAARPVEPRPAADQSAVGAG